MNQISVVRNSDQHITSFDKTKIASSVFKEINYVAETLDLPPQISKGEAHFIANKVEKTIGKLKFNFLSGPLIREITSMELLKFDDKRGNRDYNLRKFYTRVGLPVADAVLINNANSDETTDNANQADNPETFHKKYADAVGKELTMLLLPHELADAHMCGDLHIHDREYFATRTFCMDHDLRFWFYYGFDSDCCGNTNIAGAAQHANVAILHCAKILGSAQTNFAGGQGFYNFLTFLAPYFEGMSYEEIEQLMQMFIFEMAQTMCARGGQVVFSSVQLPPGVPTLWKDQPVVYKGKKWDGENGTTRKVYGDFEREVRLGFEAIMKVMLKGDVWEKPFNFPKPEVAFEKEFLTKHEDDEYFNDDSVCTYSELYDLVFEVVAKHGTPYFDNMVPDYRDTGGIECYQCCSFSFSATMESDDKYQDKIDFKNGEHFSMGGVQVISLNSPRAAYKAKQNDFDSLMVETKKIIDQAIQIQKIKKQWMRRQFDKGLVPFATQQLTHPVTKEKSPPLVDFDELVYIIGMVGLNEVAWHHTGHQLSTQEGYEFGVRYMNHLKSYIHTRGDEEGINLVLARTPAETTCQRFAVSDLINYPKFARKYVSGDLNEALNKLHESRNLPVYYSNGTHLPVDMDVPFTERINIEETFFPILDGGNIFHVWLNEENPDPQGVKDFVMNIIKNTLVGYFALTKNFTLCRDCYKQSGGINDNCPHCDSENVESFSRITGYIQSTAGWNEAKKEELKRRLKTNIG